MENNNKKRIQRVNAAPRKLIIKRLQSALFSKFDNNKRSFNCEIISNLETTFFRKLPRKKAQADQRLPYRNYVNVN